MTHQIGEALAFAADGTSDEIPLPNPVNDIASKLRSIYAWGTFGGGTITVEVTPDNATWFALTNPTFTAKGLANIEIKALAVRFVLAGATSPAINVVIH